MEFVPFGAKEKIKLSVAIIQNLVAVKTKSGKTCSDSDAIKFMMMCQARLLNPFEGDAYLIGYDSTNGPTFSLITAHQAFLKRAEVSPEYDGMKSGIIVRQEDALRDLEGDFYEEGQTVVGGWATVYFKNRKQPMHKRIRLQRFQKAWGIWQDDPAGMICKCAEADALRSSFPTMLGGLYLREEVETKKPAFASPEFSPNPLLVEKPQPTESSPEPSSTPAKALAAETGTIVNHLKLLRGYLANAGLKEPEVVNYLKVDDIATCKSLDELAESKPELMEVLATDAPDLIAKIKKEKGE